MVREILRENLNEVVDAEDRCTNNALASMGICLDDPVMNIGQAISAINNNFSDANIVDYSGTKSDEKKSNMFFLYPTNGTDEVLADLQNSTLKEFYPYSFKESSIDYPPGLPLKFDTAIIKAKTVNNLIQLIKANGPTGTYFVGVRGHVLVIHKLSSGETYVIDTEMKFGSRAIVRKLLYVDRDPSEELHNWMENNSEKAKEIVTSV